jgi:hypothetical protein
MAAHHSGVAVYVLTPTQRDLKNPGESDTAGLGPNSLGKYLVDYRDAMVTLCETYAVPVIDLYAISTLNVLTATVNTSDGLHWNQLFATRVGKLIGRNINIIAIE